MGPRPVIASIEGEYRRYKALGEGVLEQLGREELCARPSPESNAISTLVWHVAGNLTSRFTDFLTADGEKPWRDREDEFAVRDASPEEVRARWADAWSVLLDTLAGLEDTHLERSVTIRGVELTVAEALHRSLAHTAGHVMQMMYVGKLLKGGGWSYLTIPPGGTSAYNENPDMERGPGAAV